MVLLHRCGIKLNTESRQKECLMKYLSGGIHKRYLELVVPQLAANKASYNNRYTQDEALEIKQLTDCTKLNVWPVKEQGILRNCGPMSQ